MNCRSVALSFLAILAYASVSLAQPSVITRGDSLKEWMKREEYFDRIDRKLERDVASTAVKIAAIDVDRFPLKSPIPVSDGNTFVLAPLGTYELLYLVNEGEPTTPSQYEIIPLAIRSQTVSGGSGGLRIGRQAAGGVTYAIVVHLKDIARLDIADQRRIINYIVQESANTSDALVVPAAANPMQPIFPNHRDFWSYAKVTSKFPIPWIEKKTGRVMPGEVRPAGKTAAQAMVPKTIVTPDTQPADTITTNVTAAWPQKEGATYTLTVARDREFKDLVYGPRSTFDTTAKLPALEFDKTYYWSVTAMVPDSGSLDSSQVTIVKSAGFKVNAAQGTNGQSNGTSRLGYTLDLSFSRVAVAHEMLYSETALGIPGFGVEIGFDDPVLSLLPYQTGAISWGGRLLLNTTGEKRDILDRDFLELKLFGRSRFNAAEFSRSMGAFKYFFTPLVTSETPRLNVAVPGYGFEIATSKWWNLPYLNFYYSGGSSGYSEPVFMYGSGGGRYAYWSGMQWRGSMAFYFNLDSEPEFYLANTTGRRLNTIHLDLGAGTYNVACVKYDSLGAVSSKTGIVKASRIQPYVSVEYVHASQVKTAFGAKAAYFDNRLVLSAWLSLFKLGNHELRLEGTDIVGPFGRSRFEWETGGSAFMQFRYRLGF
jgi:hypothetical protein